MENKLKDPIAIEKKQIVCIIDYNKLNALYEDFVPQKELSAEQKYFSSTFIPSENPSNARTSNSSSKIKPPLTSMPSSNPMKLYLEKMENEIASATWKQNELLNDQLLKAKLKHEIKLKAAPSVRRPSNRDSSFKNSVLSNNKKSSEKVEVYVCTNKKTDVAYKNVVSNKKIVTDVDVKNALKAKNVLCVSCAKNMLILCHDKCLANYKLNVHSKVRRALFTTHRTTKSMFVDTTPVVSKTRFSVKTTQFKSLDTTPVVSKTKIAAVTHLSAKNKVVQIVMWIVDSGFSKHMTSDRSLLKIFVKKFMRTDRFGNDHFAAITGYGDYVQGNITICHVYYFEGLGHNLFSGQFCDDMAASSPVCLMSKATSTKSWLWHRRLSHLNFRTINDLTKHDLVDGLPKFKYSKDHLCSACSMQQFSIARTPQQNSVVERRNRTLVEAARTMLIFSRLPEFLWAEAISTACFTQNWSIIHPRYNKTPYELLHDRKLNVEYFYVFGSLCYPTNDREDLGKIKPKEDIGIFIRSSEVSINSTTQQVHNNEDSPLTSSIIIEQQEAPPIVSTSEEQTSPILMNQADELNQEDSAKI
ncbi:retrovirus-related pol polyprotein from transposon TNT 1-94 [Tanacetum coccineum]